MFQVDVDYLKRAKKRKDHGRVVILVFLTLAGLVSLLPLVYLVCTAFKPAEELFLYPPTFFVKNPTGVCETPHNILSIAQIFFIANYIFSFSCSKLRMELAILPCNVTASRSTIF